MTKKKANRPAISTGLNRRVQVGVAAALMLAASPAALHAEISNAELAAQIAELKAQIRALKGGVAEVRRSNRGRVVAAPVVVAPPPTFAALPPGATPVYATVDKKLQFGSLTITPGGYFAAEGVFRTRAQNRELESQVSSVPFGPQAGANETRLSGRGSRAALLIEAPISKSNIVAGYAELDFQQVGVGSNYNQSSSFVPRIRNLYATLDNSDYGLHVLAGQSFSLATINSKGITPRNEALPAVINYNYVAGFVYKRQAQIRLVKDFDKKLWLGLSVENAQNTYTGCNVGANNTTAVGTASAETCSFTGAGSLAGAAATPVAGGGVVGTSGVSGLSFNRVPDVIGKVAYEAKLGQRDIHLEAFGLFRDITNRDLYNAAGGVPNAVTFGNTATYDKVAGSVGFGIVLPVIPKTLDFQANGLIGRGIGTYGTSQFTDATLNSNGSPIALRQENFSGGFVLHATPSFDFYTFAGVETAHQSTTVVNGAFVGYGAPNANNSGCFNVASNGTCAGNNKRALEIVGGVWDKLYKGQFGEVRVGVQYSYEQRELFQGSGATAGIAGALNFAPKQNEHIVYTSLRYYPFQ